MVVVVAAGGACGAVPVPAVEPVASVVAEVLDAVIDDTADEASAAVSDVPSGDAAVIQQEFEGSAAGFLWMA